MDLTLGVVCGVVTLVLLHAAIHCQPSVSTPSLSFSFQVHWMLQKAQPIKIQFLSHHINQPTCSERYFYFDPDIAWYSNTGELMYEKQRNIIFASLCLSVMRWWLSVKCISVVCNQDLTIIVGKQQKFIYPNTGCPTERYMQGARHILMLLFMSNW